MYASSLPGEGFRWVRGNVGSDPFVACCDSSFAGLLVPLDTNGVSPANHGEAFIPATGSGELVEDQSGSLLLSVWNWGCLPQQSTQPHTGYNL